MSSLSNRMSEVNRLPTRVHLNFGALGKAQLRNAGARKLPADDEVAGAVNILQDLLEVGVRSRAKRGRDFENHLVLNRWCGIQVYVRRIAFSAHQLEQGPNQPPEPTVMSVTPPAAQEPRQP